MSINIEILKKLLREADEETAEPQIEPEVDSTEEEDVAKTPFEKDPIGFILKKYITLKDLLEELMTPSFEEYLNAIFIVAPKPTTFKVVLHNGQHFFLTYLDKAYQATIGGKNYYLLGIGEKQLAMQAIARLLRYGTPLKTQGPAGAEQGTEVEGGEAGLGGEETGEGETGETGGGGTSDGGEFGALGAEAGAAANPPGVTPKKKSELSENIDIVKQSIILEQFTLVNRGLEYEKKFFRAMKAAAGKKLNSIKNEDVKQVFKAVNVNPAKLTPKDIVFTGNTASDRPLSIEGPKNVGQSVADIIIVPTKTYISLKDVGGKSFYSGKNVPFIVEEDGKIKYDPSKHSIDPIIDTLFLALGINPRRVAMGLNHYQNGTDGKKNPTPTSYKEVESFDKKLMQKLLASGYGFGYYYVRKGQEEMFVYNVNGKAAALNLVGEVTSVRIKYPGINTKIMTVELITSSKKVGDKKYYIEFRNTGGKLVPLQIKMQLSR